MNTKPFVHLHLHTKYSLLDGACHIEPLVDRCLRNGMPAVAMTDHGVMYGIIDFYKTCRAKGVKPILGCETYITPSASRHDRTPHSPFHHLVLLAENATGYRNLSRLISLSHLEGHYYKPRIDKEILARYSEGLIGMSACLHGEITEWLAHGNLDAAERVAGQYRDIFGKDRFFLEVQDHGIAEQRRANANTPELTRRTGLRAVATNDVHYLDRAHAEAHEAMLALQTQTVLSDPKRMRYATDQFYFKTREEMERVFPNLPEALDLSVEIAERCNVEIEFGSLHFPTFEVPAGMTQREYLVAVGYENLRRLYGIADCRAPKDRREKAVVQRFDDEIEIIERTGFVNYFLVVRDFVDFARRRGISVGPGRGSGGGSLVAYACGITNLDPMRFNLIFERFLNPDRVSPPDFDIDFCQARRGEVIEYVKNKYGEDHVAQIVTFGSLGAKTVIRDLARVLEIPLQKSNFFAAMVPEDPKMTLTKARTENPEFDKQARADPDLRTILKYGEVIEGLYRNTGVHAAGVVIGDKPLIDILPLARDKDGNPITQYSKENVEEVGLLKMDFLGLKTLTVLAEAADLAKKTRGVEIDLDHLPMDDRPTYELLSRAETIGVFQLESSGMRELIRQIGINNIEDLIAVIALYRPGPMNMLPDFIARKTGKAAIVYDHPLLEPILKDTYGVMVYQEQVQQAAHVLAGYSLGEADLLRRAMGKKKAEEMAKQRARFVQGCMEKNKIPRKLAEHIFDNIATFAGYGFNKAHSAGYGIVSYQTAYMKANYPAEFMCGLISSEIGNSEKLPVFIDEAARMNLEVLPPDVNHSVGRFVPEGRGIRYGLAGIKGVGQGAAEAIVRAREAEGPFKNLVDFCVRVDSSAANRRVLESLIRSGAMDPFKIHRARLFENIEFAMARAAAIIRDRNAGQGSLFDLTAVGGGSDETADDSLPDCRPWPKKTCLAGERELLGIYVSGHPLDGVRDLLASCSLADIAAFEKLPDGRDTRVGGLLVDILRKTEKRTKNPWAIVKLSDGIQTIEVLVFAGVFQHYAEVLQLDTPLLICGQVSRRDDQPKLIAQEIYALEDAPLHFADRVGIQLPTPGEVSAEQASGALRRLFRIIQEHPGEIPTLLCRKTEAGRRVLIQPDAAFTVRPDAEFIRSVQATLGPKSVRLVFKRDPYVHGNGRSKRRFRS